VQERQGRHRSYSDERLRIHRYRAGRPMMRALKGHQRGRALRLVRNIRFEAGEISRSREKDLDVLPEVRALADNSVATGAGSGR